jgi:hypothetical protein
LRSYVKEKVAAPVQKVANTVIGIRRADHVTLLLAKVGTNFAEKQRLARSV